MIHARGREEWGERPRESVTCEAADETGVSDADKSDTPKAVRVSAVTGNRAGRVFLIPFPVSACAFVSDGFFLCGEKRF